MRLAEDIGASILSIDSMQVYRGMDIGTAKPSREERRRVPHLMIDIVDPSEPYSVASFQTEARRLLRAADGPVVIAGGSGLHMRAVLDPLEFPPHDPAVRAWVRGLTPSEQVERLLDADREAGTAIDLRNPRRVERALEIHRVTGRTPSDRARTEGAKRVERYESEIEFVGVGVDPGDTLAARVEARVEAMFAAGLVGEVASLDLGPTAGQALGYKEVLAVVAGTMSEEDAAAEMVWATLALAKRQRTFFRRDPRITWLEWHDDVDQRYATLRRQLDTVLA